MAENFPEPIKETPAAKAETQGERERRIRAELVAKGREYLIPDQKESKRLEFKFVEPKLQIPPEKLPAGLNWNLFSKNISVEDKKSLSLIFKQLADYLGGPIITDNFIYHDDRGKWEEKYRNKLSPEAWERYKNNRLGLTNASRPKALLTIFSSYQKDYGDHGDIFIDPSTLARLEGLVSIMPEEVKDGSLYGKTELDRKIKISEKLGPIFSATVRMLGEPIEEQIVKQKN